MNRRVIAVAVAFVGCLIAAGCHSGGASKSYTVGIVGFAAADPTSQLAIKGYTDEAKIKGWKVSTVDPQGSPDKAVAAIQDFVLKKVDLIAVTVFPSSSLAAGLQQAKAAGIPVVSLSGGLADGVQVNWDTGYPQGKTLADNLVAETGGKGNLLVLGYKSGLPCVGREQALDDDIKKTQLAVTRDEVPIPGQVEAGTRFAHAWLANHPNNGAGMTIWGCFDDPSIGAITAIKQAGRSGIRVYGINGTPSALKAVQAGDMDATIFLDVYSGGKQVADATPGYIAAGVNAKPKNVPLPSVVVDKDNVARFLHDHPSALAGA